MESLVAGRPHIVVEVGSGAVFEAGVVVPVYELLLQEPVGGFDHGVVVRVALPDGDLLMSNTSSSSSIFALSNSLPRAVWNTSTSVRGSRAWRTRP